MITRLILMYLVTSSFIALLDYSHSLQLPLIIVPSLYMVPISLLLYLSLWTLPTYISSYGHHLWTPPIDTTYLYIPPMVTIFLYIPHIGYMRVYGVGVCTYIWRI